MNEDGQSQYADVSNIERRLEEPAHRSLGCAITQKPMELFCRLFKNSPWRCKTLLHYQVNNG